MPEDNPDWRKIWGFVGELFEEGTKISWATSASEADKTLSQAETQGTSFHIVVADIFLSGSRTGIDFFEGVSPRYKKRLLLVSSVSPEKVEKHFQNQLAEHYVDSVIDKVIITARRKALSGVHLRFKETDRFIIRELDITQEEDIGNLVSEIFSLWGAIDIVVNNAGICYRSGSTTRNARKWLRAYHQYFIGQWNRCDANNGLLRSVEIRTQQRFGIFVV